nr:hypothetical protein [Deltaproteobacteria bacterium]
MYIRGRIGLGYGTFQYEGSVTSTGVGSTASYPAQSASGFVAGVGLSVGARLTPTFIVGGVLNFDPLFAPRGSNASGAPLPSAPTFIPNGTVGAMVAWEPTPCHHRVRRVLRRGGAQGLPGGLGLVLRRPRAQRRAGRGFELGPIVHAAVSPLMVDPIRDGGLQFYSIDVGVTLAPAR